MSTYFEIQQKAQKEIDKHETSCETFKYMLQKGFIDKQEGATCDYYYLNLIGAKKTELSIHPLDNCIVESHMIYNCPFCFAKLMIPVDTGEYDSL